jgi:hypothetical protein
VPALRSALKGLRKSLADCEWPMPVPAEGPF